MTRRKSACSKWTLVLLLVIVCPYVYSRPQENASPAEPSVSENVVKSTQNPLSHEDTVDHSTEVSKKSVFAKPIKHIINKIKKIHKKPKPDYSEETQVYPDNIYVTNDYHHPSTRPIYIFNTPSPTPIISNVGNPKPWSRPNVQSPYHTLTTQRPVLVTKPPKNNYHNSVYNNYPHHSNHDYEVTTFQPTNAYTDRIIIRPDEYSASPEECPTIFLTLNNTFQGQGKEACPDLNIAVNTNVINKNVVVESDEEEGEGGIFADPFGIPFEDESGDETASTHDIFDSDENQEQINSESASVEGLSYSNYNAATDGDSSEPGGVGSASQVLSSYQKPEISNDEDDSFSISSFYNFFKPAINALGWLSTINPFGFGLLSFFLAPIVFLFAGTSGIAALFAPWAFSAREAPKVVHVHRPYWHWDDEIKTWHLHSFPNNRNWDPTLPRSIKELGNTNNDTIKPTLFYRIKEWMKVTTQRLKINNDRKANQHHRKNRRKKRETWTKRIKGSNQQTSNDKTKQDSSTTAAPATPESSRDVKTKGPVIRDSIKMVANQLLDKTANNSGDTPIVPDTRIPPKLKNQLAHKHKIKVRNEDNVEPIENAHVGIAVPMTMEELESENKVSESSTSNEGISTWILLSNTSNATVVSTEPTKLEENQKKHKPTSTKNKNKRPQTNKVPSAKRPIIGSTNKSDLIAGGSAINENVFNKIKDTVLTNVHKNKNTPTPQMLSTTTTTTTVAPTSEEITTIKEKITKAPSSIIPVIKVTSKPAKKKNKNKTKITTTSAPVEEIQESALLPMEPKETEIELEISTPATTTKKPKRSSTRKKNKTKKRKTSKPKPDSDTAVSEIKTTSNKTKSTKPSKKPSNPTGPLSTQIYNYLSREVMPSVGVGVIGLASLVGLASYFLYPFSTPVRRTIEVDKKDDLYRNNAEEYANEGNGQAEEEMLGTVLAGMPAHSKQKLNPYAGQTHINRYTVKKEPENIRYRHVATNYEPNYNVHYPQQKTGIAHGAVYSKPVNYGPQQYETRNVYTTESKYVYDKSHTSYTPSYSVVEPIYAAPQTGPSAISSFENDAANTVVYGVKPSADTDFRPVYPFEGKIFSETTSNPVSYPPTSMYLGSNSDSEQSAEEKYDEDSETNTGSIDNKFVVGNVPKELAESATPAVVPEHGPRNIRKKRSVSRRRNIRGNIEEMLKEANKDIFISNEIDDVPGMLIRNLASPTEFAPMMNEVTPIPENKEVSTIYATSVDPSKEILGTNAPDSVNEVIIENISTMPIDVGKEKVTTETDQAETTTKSFRVYEVFTNNPTEIDEKDLTEKLETTTQFKNMMTETTTELKSETTSTIPPPPSPVSETKLPPQSPLPVIPRPKPTLHPEVITYPPLNQEGGFFSFLKRLVEFKYRLGLSILQTTSDNLNRYLRSIEDSMQKVAKASQ
ncbi:unnamed protein product [Diatraea saccharalis]|uniref:Uncharacterized protein n=1 Tax=Diatraea saccharalis TaxID=40085 RepID=A0A9N9WDA7_9NEOP|nr:unnamed protein product [Diatraea saccharalis]